MSKSSDSLRQEFLDNRDYKSYRHAYADESLNIAIATQIKVLREMREWKQGDLARHAEMTQPMISRYENVNYSSWSLNTLKKLALAFDVWLDVRFRSFGELVRTTEEFSRESLQVPKFDDDSFFRARETVKVVSNRQGEANSKASVGEPNASVDERLAFVGKSQSSGPPPSFLFPTLQRQESSPYEHRLAG
jgi:transcriptional regulator with XRE-family HTH domain